MSGHADIIRSSALFAGRPDEQQLVNVKALWELWSERDALVAENQQLRDALRQIAHWPVDVQLTANDDLLDIKDFADRAALDGTPSEESSA